MAPSEPQYFEIASAFFTKTETVFKWRPRNDEHSAKQDTFQNSGVFVIARLAKKLDEILIGIGKPKQTKFSKTFWNFYSIDHFVLNRIVAVQVSDTTVDDSSTAAGYQITFFFQRPLRK